MSELYFKNEKVLTLKDIDGVPGDIYRIDTPELLPFCFKKSCKTEDFLKWLNKRSIPDKREGLDRIKKEYGTGWMKSRNFASLTDQYWLKMREETWKKINFFTNMYSTDIGDITFTPWAVKKKKINNNSPDLTTNGLLMKRWIQKPDKTSMLAKAGSLVTHQEPLSEVLVSVLCERLNIIPCVKYDLRIVGTTMCSVCDNFITQNTSLVPAAYIYNLEQRKDTESVYMHLVTMLEKAGVPKARDFIDGMIFIDKITGNKDRNLSNIGAILDVNTGKFISMAPLYDSGNAYWSTHQIEENINSVYFGDVENVIFKKMLKDHDISFLKKSSDYKEIINAYPNISEVKKSNLIEAIGKQNTKLCIRHDMIRDGF